MLDKLDQEFKLAIKDMLAEAPPMLRTNLQRLGYRYTDALYNGLRISEEFSADSWELVVQMPAYGKTLEMKRRFAFGATVQDLADWVKRRGLDNFSSIPGYERSGTVPAKAAVRIALAIQNSNKTMRYGIAGGTIGNYKGSARQRYKKSQMVSWFYRPYFGMWATKRERVVDYYFEQVPIEAAEEIRDTYQAAINAATKHIK